MSTIKVLAALAIGLTALSSSAGAEQRLSGTWLTEDKSTHVVFQSCGAADCGKVVWLKEPMDPDTGQAWRDKFNSDESQKRRPLMGLTIASGLKPSGAGRWEGAIYNPDDGKTYSGEVQLVGQDRLQLKGCAFGGLVCESEVWSRISP